MLGRRPPARAHPVHPREALLDRQRPAPAHRSKDRAVALGLPCPTVSPMPSTSGQGHARSPRSPRRRLCLPLPWPPLNLKTVLGRFHLLTKPTSPGSPCTTCATSPCPPPRTSTPTSPDSPPARPSTPSPGSRMAPTMPSSDTPSAAPSTPGASARSCTGNCPPTSRREQKNQPRPGRCGPETTVRPPADTTTERAGTRFPKYPLSQPTSLSGRQDLNLRPLDPQSSALPSCATSRGLGACSGAWGALLWASRPCLRLSRRRGKQYSTSGGARCQVRGVGWVRGWGGGRRR